MSSQYIATRELSVPFEITLFLDGTEVEPTYFSGSVWGSAHLYSDEVSTDRGTKSEDTIDLDDIQLGEKCKINGLSCTTDDIPNSIITQSLIDFIVEHAKQQLQHEVDGLGLDDFAHGSNFSAS
jgi:hypothetical protein|tara:strand:- start:531 stop:902 length:372 start_codon:yes stop_codon:yes gene_type:complete